MTQEQQQRIATATAAVKNGGVIVFPTDTAYALGGDFRNEQIIERILHIKGRTNRKFTVIASSLEQAQEFFALKPHALDIAKQHWPGPLSIAVNDQFSVRVPDSDIARAIAQQAGTPLIATSANKSGDGETYTLDHAREALATDDVDEWVDGGALEKKQPSTIIRVNTEGVQVLRQGPITL